jgi:hypothetical protein
MTPGCHFQRAWPHRDERFRQSAETRLFQGLYRDLVLLRQEFNVPQKKRKRAMIDLGLHSLIFVCTAHLCLGYLAGRRGVIPAAQILPLSHDVLARSRATTRLALELPEGVPEELRTALLHLEKSARQLHATCSTASPTNTQHPAVVQPTARPEESSASPSIEQADRRAYHVHQYVAVGCASPDDVTTFERILCHDLSAVGMSFFLDRALPDGERLILSLGTSAAIRFVAAQVVYSRAMVREGEDCFRIGCRFLQKLPDAANATLVARLREHA